MNKYNRTDYYKTVNVDGIQEKDLLTNTTHIFDDKTNYQFYTVKEQDLLRPDLLSIKFYGSQSYWWIILKANDIEDVWNELYVGQVLAIPPQSRIELFFKESVKNAG